MKLKILSESNNKFYLLSWYNENDSMIGSMNLYTDRSELEIRREYKDTYSNANELEVVEIDGQEARKDYKYDDWFGSDGKFVNIAMTEGKKPMGKSVLSVDVNIEEFAIDYPKLLKILKSKRFKDKLSSKLEILIDDCLSESGYDDHPDVIKINKFEII